MILSIKFIKIRKESPYDGSKSFVLILRIMGSSPSSRKCLSIAGRLFDQVLSEIRFRLSFDRCRSDGGELSDDKTALWLLEASGTLACE